jgi:hypothetical protein
VGPAHVFKERESGAAASAAARREHDDATHAPGVRNRSTRVCRLNAFSRRCVSAGLPAWS